MDGKKKVLLWGVYSPWTMNFVENFLLKNNYDIWIPIRGNKKEYKKYIDFYKEKNVHLIKFPKVVSEVYDEGENKNIFRNWYCHFLTIKEVIKSGPYDLINMQYVECLDLIDVVILKYIMRTKLILSYWGSDLLRLKENRLLSVGKLVRQAHFITFDNIDLEIEFKSVYRWRKKIPSKVILFGLPVLDIINEKSKATENIRKKWGIPENKTVIAIGYNGIPEQQHKKILGAIGRLEEQYKKKIVLLLQMSYGGTREYKRTVITAAKKTGCKYIDIQHFLTNDEVAELRIVTDVFINAQVTDAFSGSVCENLFADTLLINAKWLRYKELEKYDFKYLEFKNFDEIDSLIKTALEQKINVSGNKELIWKLRSWECSAIKWEKVYKRMCK